MDTQSIALFVGELPIKKTQRIRYLRLIERVLDHVRRSEYGSTNPARFIAQDGEASWRSARDNDPTGFIAPVERAALLACLFSPLPAGGSAHWKERRDRALVTAFLGAGLKTGEAQSLAISCIKSEATILTVHASQPDTGRPRLPRLAERPAHAQGHDAASGRRHYRNGRHHLVAQRAG